jgi:predicted deacylase
MIRFSALVRGVLLAFILAGAALADDAIKVPLQTQRTWDFANAGVHFDCNFSGARLGGCEQTGDHEFRVLVTPENQPINPSPWYAFKVRSDKSQTITVRLVYIHEGPRGRPWLSRDGSEWSRIEERRFARWPETNAVSVRLDVEPRPLWVAAWEVVGLEEMSGWTDKMCRLPFAREETAGRSIEGRSLRAFVLGETTNANFVFVIGRQHPPEITGTMGLESFVETIAGDSDLARRFRRQFQLVVLPVMNPDGVEHGHWRSNLGGVDLNRDWRKFSQPETAATRDWLLHYIKLPGARSALFLDFHSTGTNIFYSVPEEKGDVDPGFTDRWLADLHRECPKFAFERDDSHNANEATSKAWAHEQMHAPAITCEFGYATDRKLIRRAAKIEAEDMMRLLLAASAKTPVRAE